LEVPVIHVLGKTKKQIEEQGYKKIGLLGSTFTMQDSFFKDYLLKYQTSPIEILTP